MILYTMVGLPGSGKSTIAKKINGTIVSSDSIRKELYGSEEIQGNPQIVFNTVYKRIQEELSKGNDVIFDATNLTKKNRKRIFQFNVTHIAVFVNTPLDVCLQRNAQRNRHVPEEIINKMYKRLAPPSKTEGYHTIITIV